MWRLRLSLAMVTPTASEKIYAHSPEASQKVAGFRRQFSIFDVVLNRYTIRGSIVGTRMDLEEAPPLRPKATRVGFINAVQMRK
jgi:D-arabinose 1-dehydrogenase-like Zn-dependent alcohol dehydrogenase